MADDENAIKIYEQKIVWLAENSIDEMFYNADEDHAKIVLRELMKNAKQYVYIVCTDMCSDVSNNDTYIEAVKGFLSADSNRKIRILFTDYKDEFKQMPIAKIFREYPEQIISIKKLMSGKITGEGDKPVNFTVSDDKAFRVEIDVKNRIAFGNFNSKSDAEILKKHFEDFFNSPRVTEIAA